MGHFPFSFLRHIRFQQPAGCLKNGSRYLKTANLEPLENTASVVLTRLYVGDDRQRAFDMLIGNTHEVLIKVETGGTDIRGFIETLLPQKSLIEIEGQGAELVGKHDNRLNVQEQLHSLIPVTIAV